MAKSKWENLGQAGGRGKGKTGSATTSGNVGSGAYVPTYAKAPARFSPKKAVRSFRDLEVYQKTIECSVLISAELIPILKKDKFPLVEGMQNCSLNIPLHIAEAHGMRFSNFDRAVTLIEGAMQGCNKMIVYLEQAQGLTNNADDNFLEDMSNRYMQVRGKMLRLERSWQKFRSQTDVGKIP
ncbi:hypothetical protein COU14_01040 [Candidatus Kaiserbacteria bacterium CG10_big_fil_rev_8_21_14_0_10_44_10]|uniref:Four helix bundle protein n=1 Tax=Candidatus Kaiserbacteria bacterium CG10_big_fil_rev_8_21_14_0_10_44_10 TaxID=1974606 RepID=A0A2H0UI23_9BACT|nr:MAG: hypothetical protein COU14_01040 [Candidatus Kaiserbacteria bacterium CG10_big_fil_rev_8_21_14_0_10_44_10]